MNRALTVWGLQLLSAPYIVDASHLDNNKLEGLEDAGDTWKDEGRRQPCCWRQNSCIVMHFSGQAWQQVFNEASKSMTGVAYKKGQHHLSVGRGGDVFWGLLRKVWCDFLKSQTTFLSRVYILAASLFPTLPFTYKKANAWTTFSLARYCLSSTPVLIVWGAIWDTLQ